MIYFIQASSGGPIKIGTTIRLTERLKQLVREAGEDLRVLAVVDGSFPEESSLHDRFSHLRAFGEWFEPGGDLLGFIVESGREWDGTDEVTFDRGAAKVDRAIVGMAKAIALSRGIPVAEYLSNLLDVPVRKDYATMLRGPESKS